MSWAASRPILVAPVSAMGEGLCTAANRQRVGGASVVIEQESQPRTCRGLLSCSWQVHSESVGREQPEAAAAGAAQGCDDFSAEKAGQAQSDKQECMGRCRQSSSRHFVSGSLDKTARCPSLRLGYALG